MFLLAILFTALPTPAQAADFAPGTRVLVKGRLKRNCAARVASNPAPGFFRLTFDNNACGDASVPYQASQLLKLKFTAKAKVAGATLKAGDAVILKGFHGNTCGARVKELTLSFASLEFDSLLCADTESLRKISELTKANLVSERGEFTLGQKVKAPGILASESCAGTIRRLTDTGFVAIDFDELTCAYGGKLYTLDQLTKAPAAAAAASKRKAISGEMIFQRVMREIASSKKGPARRL